MNAVPLPAIATILLPAYSPCGGFSGTCQTMRWAPQEGHVPRGFCGATGDPRRVQLVLIVAEPGDPHPFESYPTSPPEAVLRSTHAYAYSCFRDGKDLFHRNVRKILDLCLPGRSFEEQMQVAFISESILCSARAEGAAVSAAIATECRHRHVERQLDAFPNAAIVALGSKASKRLSGRAGVISAFAAAPPSCNFRGAEESWRAAAVEVRARAG
jgi:hypothetical protein